MDPGLAHGIQERGVFRRLHSDLREEHHALGQLGQARHEFESLFAHRLQLAQPMVIILLLGQLQVFERDRIEVVVRESNEAKSHAAQLDNFPDDRIRGALAGALAVRAPHRTKRAVFGASAHGLHRSPHVAIAPQQIPARRQELVRLDTPPLIGALRSPRWRSRPPPSAK